MALRGECNVVRLGGSLHRPVGGGNFDQDGMLVLLKPKNGAIETAAEILTRSLQPLSQVSVADYDYPTRPAEPPTSKMVVPA